MMPLLLLLLSIKLEGRPLSSTKSGPRPAAAVTAYGMATVQSMVRYSMYVFGENEGEGERGRGRSNRKLDL